MPDYQEKRCGTCDHVVDNLCRRFPPDPDYPMVVTPGMPEGRPACAEHKQEFR